MAHVEGMSGRLRVNWGIDAALLVAAIVACISGIYFLFLPLGGYRGGSNPTYGIEILFERHTWEELHVWGGLAMTAAALIHLAGHWQWVWRMARRVARTARGGGSSLTPKGWTNLGLNLVVALSFALCAASGVYLWLVPGGHAAPPETYLLFSGVGWDLLHTWSGVVFIAPAVLHLAIHWPWVVKTTARLVRSVVPRPVTPSVHIDPTH